MEKCITYRGGISLATYFYLNFRMARDNFLEFGIICKGLNYLGDNRYRETQAGKLEKNTIPLSTMEGLFFCSKHLLDNSLQMNDK